MAAVSWVFQSKNNKSVSAKIITGLSLSILSAEKGQNFFQVVVLILEAAIAFFACGALAASISVGIVIPSTWSVYLYNILLA